MDKWQTNISLHPGSDAGVENGNSVDSLDL